MEGKARQSGVGAEERHEKQITGQVIGGHQGLLLPLYHSETPVLYPYTVCP